MSTKDPPETPRVAVRGAHAALAELVDGLRRLGHEVTTSPLESLPPADVHVAIVEVGEAADDAGFAELALAASRERPPRLVAAAETPGPDVVLRALRAGVVDFLPLPIALPDVLRAVRRSRPLVPAPVVGAPRLVPLRVVEREHVLSVLAAVGGNKQRAAKILGVDRKTLYRRLRQFRASADESE